MSKSGSVCAVFGCDNYMIQKGPIKSFFRMPRDIERLKKWIHACKRSDLDELLKVKHPEYFNKTYLVCSDHFEMEWFRNKDLFSQGLLPGAIPTLNLYNVPNKKKRKSRDLITPIIPIIMKMVDGHLVNVTRNDSIKVETMGGHLVNATRNDSSIKVETMDKPIINTNRDESNDQREISRLKLAIDRYRRLLRNKNSLIYKYRKRSVMLKTKLTEYQRNNGCDVTQSNARNKICKRCKQFISTQKSK